MNVKRKDLQIALQRCLPGVETGNALLSGADSFIFKDGMIHSYNDNISVSVPFVVPEEEIQLEGAVKAKEFYAIVSKLPSDDIKIAINDGVWNMKSGAANVELNMLESGILEHIQGISTTIDWKPLPVRFLEALQQCKIGCNRSAMSGIYASGNFMVSTDEMTINQYAMDKEVDPFWIADPAAGELMKLAKLAEYALSTSWAQFKTAEGTMFSCKRLQHDKFPFDKIQTLIANHAQQDGDVSTALPDKLLGAVERAAGLSMDIDSFDAVKLTVSKTNIEVHSQRSTGKYTEKVTWDKPIEQEFEPVVLYVAYSMIGYGLKRSKNIYIKQTQKGESIIKRVVFKGEHFVNLVSTFNPKV